MKMNWPHYSVMAVGCLFVAWLICQPQPHIIIHAHPAADAAHEDMMLKSLVADAQLCEIYKESIVKAPSAEAIGMTNMCHKIETTPKAWIEK